MTLRPLGYAGVQQRVATLQARLNQVNGRNSDAAMSIPELTKPFGGAPPAPMSGSINNPQAGLQPMNPMLGGVQLAPQTLEAGRAQFGGLIKRIAAEVGIDHMLLQAVVEQESAYRPNAVSRAGAQGLTQLMPGTARELGVTDPFDPEQNLRGGATYLSRLLKQFNGDIPLTLAGYNAGPGAVSRLGRVPNIPETQNYVKKITEQLAKWRDNP